MKFGEVYVWKVGRGDSSGVTEGKWEVDIAIFIAYMNETLKEEWMNHVLSNLQETPKVESCCSLCLHSMFNKAERKRMGERKTERDTDRKG